MKEISLIDSHSIIFLLSKYYRQLLFAALIIFAWLLGFSLAIKNIQLYLLLLLALVILFILFETPFIVLGFFICSFATLNELLLIKATNIKGLGELCVLDYLFFGCLVVFTIQILSRKRDIHQTPLNRYIIILLGVSFFALVRGFMILGNFDSPIARFRVMTYWIVFFLYIWAIADLKQLKFIFTALILTVLIASILSIVNFSLGKFSEMTITAGSEYVARLPGPVSAKIIPVMLFMLIATVNSVKGRFNSILYRITIPVTFLALILRFTRGHWIGFMVGFIYLLSFRQFKYRKQVMSMVVIFAIVLVVILSTTWQVDPAGSISEDIILRSRGIYDPDPVQDISTLVRLESIVVGLKVLFIHPLKGFGFGGYAYRAIHGFGLTKGLYNSYLLWGIETGIVGLFFLVLFFIVAIRRGRFIIRHIDDKFWKNFMIGIQCSLIAILTTAFTQYTFQEIHYVFILAFLIACPEIIYRSSCKMQDSTENNKSDSVNKRG